MLVHRGTVSLIVLAGALSLASCMCDGCNVLRESHAVVSQPQPPAHSLLMSPRNACLQELRPGAVALLAAAAWVAMFLGFTMLCTEKCFAVRGSAVLPQPSAPRPPPYNPEYLKVRLYLTALAAPECT